MILNKIILDDLKDISNSNIEWQQLKNKTILITGASGMIASYLVYTLLYLNDTKSLNIKVIGLVRNIEKAKKHFKNILKREDFHIIKHDVRNEFYQDINIDYIIHAASQTDPHSFMFNPVETLETNVLGTNNFLKLAVKNKAKFLLLSTREIYGQPKDNARYVTENEYGILNHTLVRSCYPEGKKIAETMVISYRKEYNVDAKIVRIAHTYGPGIILGDGRVLGDFLNNYLNNENIVLKSEGNTELALTYIVDTINGIFKVLLNFNDWIYNISKDDEVVTVKELANIIINIDKNKKLKLIFDLPKDSKKETGYLQNRVAILSSEKARKEGWKANYNLKNGLNRCIEYFCDEN